MGRKLLMIEHDKHGTYYFTKQSYAAKAIGTTYGYLHTKLNNGPCTLKGWHIEEIEDNGNIMSMYIDQPVFFTKEQIIRY